MPLFGSRMVCETANYKYIERRDKNFGKRENALKRYICLNNEYFLPGINTVYVCSQKILKSNRLSMKVCKKMISLILSQNRDW